MTNKIQALEIHTTTDKIQALERLTNKNKNVLADATQALEGLTIDEIQAFKRPTTNENQTGEFRAEPITPLHYEAEGKT